MGHQTENWTAVLGSGQRKSPPEPKFSAGLRWSGWVYAYRTFWLDPGPHWDEEKTAEFLEIGVPEALP